MTASGHQLREAASVILLRAAEPGFEVFLLRRRKGASFMASAFVFPGGGVDAGEDARTAAARELFEEAGVLLARADPSREREAGESIDTLEAPSIPKIRQTILAGANAAATLGKLGLAFATDGLVPWAHWITPSIEPKRFSARFFVCQLPPGQTPRFDAIETVDQVWVRPPDALTRAGELALPPPQLRTLWELAEHSTIASVLAAARLRADEPHPIMPRLAANASPPCLLLPWDPDYVDGGTGDATPLTYQPHWARGPSRFVMEQQAWRHIAPPTAPTK